MEVVYSLDQLKQQVLKKLTDENNQEVINGHFGHAEVKNIRRAICNDVITPHHLSDVANRLQIRGELTYKREI